MSVNAWDSEPLLAAFPLADPSRREDADRRLHAVTAPAAARRPRLLYGVIAVAGAVAIAGAQMGLSILMTQGSYELKELTTQQRTVDWQKQILEDDVAGLSSPQYLAANAAALGMVTGQAPSYLRLSDGGIIGAGKAASGTSSIEALKKAAVPNALAGGVPLATDPDSSLGSGATSDPELVIDPAVPPAVADGLPTPNTH
ncbi:hypothetical protein [Microbacterium sp. T2.11-28]|uniref:hypothetical protein n=1 Tax=unclassified Microbacterium TaxID=2609290 RepID=UPI00247792FA|nr:hypothetical protein [Microbacterium sp. T2.11-28]CAI9392148.1 hypothetical protein MICABA_02015 [Microbacterium sp. T2.11-28]